VELFYDALYKVATASAQVSKRDSDVQRLLLKREGQAWKIVSGL